MTINTYLSTIESKKQTKQTRRTETESWIWRRLPDGKGCGEVSAEMSELGNINRLQNSYINSYKIAMRTYRKCSSQRTNTHDPWT